MREILVHAIILCALGGIAAGRLPPLRMNRASMALAFAALLVAAGALSLEEALEAVDGGTLLLLFSTMLVVANLHLAGFFTEAGARILSAARGPRSLLALVVGASGLLSALFLNDTVCLMLTPLVAELAGRSRRDPLPYLIGLATGANVGSAMTLIGNPQNMLIGSWSGIPFGEFFLRLAPPSLAGLGVCWLVIVLVFPAEFRRSLRLVAVPATGGSTDRRLVAKSLAAAALMLVLLVAGTPAPLAALVAAAILLFTRRTAPERVFAEVDFSLLVFFAGLFVITRAIGDTAAFRWILGRAAPGSPAALAGVSALLSNLVSNVPTVMLLRPVAEGFADSDRAWLVLAMASTFAGNLTLLGSVANLIVAEGARPFGARLGFGAYLRAGLPITLATIALGTAWLLVAPAGFPR